MEVLIINRIPNETTKEYKEDFETDYSDSLELLSKEELKTRIKGAGVSVCLLSEKIDPGVIDAADSSKIIVNYEAGFDNTDINYAKEKGVIVTNASTSISIELTAELTSGLIINLLGDITKMNSDCYGGSFEEWKLVYGLEGTLEGETLGTIRLRKVGIEVMGGAKAFNTGVIFYNRSKKGTEGAGQVGLGFLLESNDAVALHTAYSDEPHHLMDVEALSKMKETVFLINLSHSEATNEKDLIDTLNDGEISSHTLDVYEFEPKISEGLRNVGNTLLAPRLGNATKLARVQIGEFIFDNVMQFRNGEIPENKVDQFDIAFNYGILIEQKDEKGNLWLTI